jgi:hypothetical protein
MNQKIIHINQLIAFRGEAFIRAVYRSILGREADPEGFEYYTERVLRLHDKIQIVHDIASSPEGASRKIEIEGLQELLRLYRPRKSRIGRFIQRLTKGLDTAARLEFYIEQLGLDLERRLGNLEQIQTDNLRHTSAISLALVDLGRRLQHRHHVENSQRIEDNEGHSSIPNTKQSILFEKFDATAGPDIFFEQLNNALRASSEAQLLSGLSRSGSGAQQR